MNERQALQQLHGEFRASWSVWEGHTCPVGGPCSLREWALHYVRDLLARGYSVAAAQAEGHRGAGSACEPGYTITHGALILGMFTHKVQPGDARRFSFAELARELREGPRLEMQTDLFGGIQ